MNTGNESLERLVISEISDFTAGLGQPGAPETPEEIHSQLMTRVRKVFADFIQQDAIKVKDLHKAHWLVNAGHAMVKAHAQYETIIPALEDVREEFPILDRQTAIAMWVAINAKARTQDGHATK